MIIEPKIVTNWDSMPPVVYAEGEIYSTRVLAEQHRIMRDALHKIKENGNDACCCRIIARAAIPETSKPPQKPTEIRGPWTSNNASKKLR